jgi:microsomal dipeptidase-like Zn-dependent dipeptidase
MAHDDFDTDEKLFMLGLLAVALVVVCAIGGTSVWALLRLLRGRNSFGKLLLASLPFLLLTGATYTLLHVVPVLVDRKLNRSVPSQRHFVDAALQKLTPAVRALHESLFVADCHADSLLWSRRPLLDRVQHGHVDVPRLLEGNVALQFFTLVTSSPITQNMIANDAPTLATDSITALALTQQWGMAAVRSKTERALVQCAQLHEKARESNGTLSVVTNAVQLNAFLLRRAKAGPNQIVAGILGVEGIHIDGDVDNIDRLRGAGVLTFGVTHFFDTPLAGSAHGSNKGGLTVKGVEAVKRVVSLGGIIDVSHASPATIDDVLALDLPGLRVIASHAGVGAVCDHVRNLHDKHIIGIARTGGVVALGFFEPTVCGDSHLESLAKGVRHVVDLVGIKHVALGSDFDGAVAIAWSAHEMVVVTQTLVDHGFTQSEIGAIMGGNVRDMLQAHLL